MTITKKAEGASVTLAVEGRLDTVTSPELEAELNASFAGTEELTLDFAGLEYISSAGLRVLLMAQKKMNAQGKMRVINVGETVGEVFDITGFSDILTVERTESV